MIHRFPNRRSTFKSVIQSAFESNPCKNYVTESLGLSDEIIQPVSANFQRKPKARFKGTLYIFSEWTPAMVLTSVKIIVSACVYYSVWISTIHPEKCCYTTHAHTFHDVTWRRQIRLRKVEWKIHSLRHDEMTECTFNWNDSTEMTKWQFDVPLIHHSVHKVSTSVLYKAPGIRLQTVRSRVKLIPRTQLPTLIQQYR